MIIHQANSREVILLGNEPWFSAMVDILNGLKHPKQEEGPKEVNKLIQQYDGILIPCVEVNTGDLQTLWFDDYTARSLNVIPLGFACYMARCKREILLDFIRSLFGINEEKGILGVIHCKDGFFVVFSKESAPTRERWRKHKNKFVPDTFNIHYESCCVNLVKEGVTPEALREVIEELTEK